MELGIFFFLISQDADLVQQITIVPGTNWELHNWVGVTKEGTVLMWVSFNQ